MIEKLDEFKHIIIFAALGIGLLNFFDVIPMDLAGKWTQWICAGIIGLAGYCYFEFHHNRAGTSPSINRRVPTRNISNPAYQRKVAAQRGPVNKPKIPQPSGGSGGAPSREVWKNFKRD